jgi:hypothetical protein
MPVHGFIIGQKRGSGAWIDGAPFFFFFLLLEEEGVEGRSLL